MRASGRRILWKALLGDQPAGCVLAGGNSGRRNATNVTLDGRQVRSGRVFDDKELEKTDMVGVFQNGRKEGRS